MEKKFSILTILFALLSVLFR